MPATVQTRELFPKTGVTKEDMDAMVELRMKAHAITSTVETEGDTWVLVTTWNVLGQQ